MAEKIKKKGNKLKRILLVIKKRVKLRMILILAIMISANTFAWFIYANKVEGGINAKVKAWNVQFEADEGELVQYVNFNIDSIYPGMETYTKSLTVTNLGESSADLSYEIVSANILGNYIEADKDGTITPELLLHSLRNDYPFKINPLFNKGMLKPNESATFTLEVSWPYESGNDELDTEWGSKAYEYNKNHPTLPSMAIEMKVMAIQTSAES